MTYGPLSELLLDGRYRVGELIGEGGFGTVYAAIHVGLIAKVAIKVPRIDELSPRAIPDAIARFLEEGRTLKQLRHPALVAALDVGLLPPDLDGLALPYLVLEWCEGTTLKEWRRERIGPMPPSEVWRVLRPAFEAIAHAHEEGIVHRDIKPANILIEITRSGEPTPRVIDFGIAKIVGEAEAAASGQTRTTSANRAFTPKHAAPEQLAGLKTGPWTDVYALALLLLEMVAGRPVWSSDEDARRAVVESDPPTPRKLGLDLGPWNEVLERALAARPADRYPDARALLRALDGPDDVGAPKVGQPWPGGSPAWSNEPPPSPQGPYAAGPYAPGPNTPASYSDANPSRSMGHLDNSVVPASHTMRTSSTGGGSPTGSARGARGRLGIVALALGGLLAVGAVGSVVAWKLHALPFASARSLDPETPHPAPGGPSTSRRPLSSLTAEEIDSRAAAGGMKGCYKMTAPGAVMLSCPGGYIHVLDKSGGVLPDIPALQKNQQHEAALGAKSYGAGRFSNDGGWTILVVGSTSLVDDVIQRILVDVRHDAIGTDVAKSDTIVPVPARLSQWTGKELAQRVVAAGGAITYESPPGAGHSVMFMVGSDAASLQMIEGDADMWLKSMNGATPFSYAADGNHLLVCFGANPLGKKPFLEKILGNTTYQRSGSKP